MTSSTMTRRIYDEFIRQHGKKTKHKQTNDIRSLIAKEAKSKKTVTQPLTLSM